MPYDDASRPGLHETPADIRRRAARVRWLAQEIGNEPDRQKLLDLAIELEARAEQVEPAGTGRP